MKQLLEYIGAILFGAIMTAVFIAAYMIGGII